MTGTWCLRLAAVGMAVALAACGGDDGAEVRDLGGSASSGSGSGSVSGSASGTASGSGSASATASGSEVACEPVGDPSEADERLEVTLEEWSVATAAPSVPAGAVQLVAFNEGEDAHELVVVAGDDPDALPRADDGTVDESALPEGDFAGEIEPFPGGTSCNGVFDLEPGNYVLFCNILEVEGGEEENHFDLGMRTTLRVEA